MVWSQERSVAKKIIDFENHFNIFKPKQAAGSVKPTLTISNNGNSWTLKLSSTFKNSETTFTEGVEFDESNKNEKFIW